MTNQSLTLEIYSSDSLSLFSNLNSIKLLFSSFLQMKKVRSHDKVLLNFHFNQLNTVSKEINGFVVIPSELQIHLLEEQDTVVHSLKNILLLPHFYKQPMTLKKKIKVQKHKSKIYLELIITIKRHIKSIIIVKEKNNLICPALSYTKSGKKCVLTVTQGSETSFV